MKQTIYLSNGRVFETGSTTPPPYDNVPDEVINLPDGWVVQEGDGQIPAMHLHDYDERDREGTTLGETGEWYPAGSVSTDGRVSPPKNIVNLQGTSWLEWMRDILGDFNFAQKAVHGDGTEDTNDDSVPVFTSDGSINPEKARKQMVCVTGGAILKIIGTIKQGGNTWDVFETMNFNNPPTKMNDKWQYNGEEVSWDTHPYLFTSRVNRKIVKLDNQTWISSRGVQASSDGGVDADGNLLGAKLKEWWPNASKRSACLLRFEQRGDGMWIERIKKFPALPAFVRLYKNSLVNDGRLVEQLGGLSLIIDAYCFYGASVYVRDKETKKWYLADEMLVRADVSTGWYARATDYRCYVTLQADGQTPWMGSRGYGIPDPGVWRKDFNF